MAPTSALPIGATRVVSEMQPLLVDAGQPGSGLFNAVLAVLAPPNPDESERYDEEVLDLSVLSYIVVYVRFLIFFTVSAGCRCRYGLGLTRDWQHGAGHAEPAHDGALAEPGVVDGQDGDCGIVRVAGVRFKWLNAREHAKPKI